MATTKCLLLGEHCTCLTAGALFFQYAFARCPNRQTTRTDLMCPDAQVLARWAALSRARCWRRASARDGVPPPKKILETSRIGASFA